MLDTFKNLNWKDVAIRALKTFLAAFLPVWAATGYNFESGAVIGACAAGITALWNFGLELWKTK